MAKLPEPLNHLVDDLRNMTDDENRVRHLIDPKFDIITKLSELSMNDPAAYQLLLEGINEIKKGLRGKVEKAVRIIVNRETKDGIARDCIDGANISEMDLDKYNTPIFNHRNLQWLMMNTTAFHQRYGYDTFLLAPYMIEEGNHSPLPENEVFDACVKLNKWIKTGVRDTTVKNAIVDVSLQYKTDALIELNDAREPWDGIPRLFDFPSKFFKLDAVEPRLSKEMIDFFGICWGKWWIGAMARCYEPGCIFKPVLLIEGEQSIGKSGLVRLFGEPFFAEDSSRNIDLNDSDVFRKLEGKWIVELAEMNAIHKSDIETVKSFISQRVDIYRPKFHEFVRTVQRRFCLISTMNPSGDGIFKDTNNVRFWPIPCGQKQSERFNFEEIIKIRDQILAEALWRYKSGEIWELTANEEQLQISATNERTVENPAEYHVEKFLKDNEPNVRTHGLHIEAIRSVLSAEGKRMSNSMLSQALRKAGLAHKRFGSGKEQKMLWYYPDTEFNVVPEYFTTEKDVWS